MRILWLRFIDIILYWPCSCAGTALTSRFQRVVEHDYPIKGLPATNYLIARFFLSHNELQPSFGLAACHPTSVIACAVKAKLLLPGVAKFSLLHVFQVRERNVLACDVRSLALLLISERKSKRFQLECGFITCINCIVINGLTQWFSTYFWTRPTFVFKKISGPTRTTTCQKYLFLLRHCTAYNVIWIVNAQTLLKFIEMFINIVSGSSALHAAHISVWFEVPV